MEIDNNEFSMLQVVISLLVTLPREGYDVSYHIHQSDVLETPVTNQLKEVQEILTVTATRRFWDGN